jgi:hypothetical protein
MNFIEAITLSLNIIGLSLLFIGSSLVTNVVGKWGGRKDSKFKWGSRIQTVGFVTSLVGILLTVIV